MIVWGVIKPFSLDFVLTFRRNGLVPFSGVWIYGRIMANKREQMNFLLLAVTQLSYMSRNVFFSWILNPEEGGSTFLLNVRTNCVIALECYLLFRIPSKNERWSFLHVTDSWADERKLECQRSLELSDWALHLCVGTYVAEPGTATWWLNELQPNCRLSLIQQIYMKSDCSSTGGILKSVLKCHVLHSVHCR